MNFDGIVKFMILIKHFYYPADFSNEKEKWDMIIAFPPCTYMTNGGAVRMYP